MRVADLIAEILAERGVRQLFTVTGGAAMHLNDAFGRHPQLAVTYCHHEQACAMAAESYGRLSNQLAVVNVTAGPGGLNALNGVFGAYVDSVGMIIVSGQAKRETMISSYNLPLRQLGDQEVDIVAVARSLTKRAVVLRDPRDTRVVVDAAVDLARSGRPGPVWIDVPIDVQSSQVDESPLKTTPDLGRESIEPQLLTGTALATELASALALLARSKRPVLVVGTGVRASGGYEAFLRVVDKLGVPVATAFNAHDLIWDTHPLYVGRPGTVGDRAGNFAVQNSDFVLILGCRLNIRQISYNWSSFAREAVKVMIDVDSAELSKPTLSIDLPIHADLGESLALIDSSLSYERQPPHREYLDWCLARRQRYDVALEPSPVASNVVDPYTFLARLFDYLDDDDVIVTGDGMACVATFQVARIKRGQRLYSNSGAASMGYDLPAAIGAAVARDGKRVICVAGDGSIMMNIQELQTISGQGLPIKIFVLNNDGYSSIRQTQTSYFGEDVMGCDPKSGLSFPNFTDVANAFGIPSRRCDSPADVEDSIRAILEESGPRLLEVIVDRDRPFAPKLSSRQLPDGQMVSSPLEDMAPFLSREEFSENLLIAPFQDD